MDQRVDEQVVIIGAGPAGLSAAYALHQRNIRPLILESGDHPGWSWQHMPRKITLLSPWKVNSLPGTRVRSSEKHKLHPCREYVQYLTDYAETNRFNLRTSAKVNGIEKDCSGFVIRGDNFQVRSTSVVSATGYFWNPNLPAFDGAEASEIHQTHVASYDCADTLKSQLGNDSPRVLVVGRRISAGQTIEDLAESGCTAAISCRGPISFAWPPWLLRIAFHVYYAYEDWRVRRNPFFEEDSYPPMEGGESRRLIRTGLVKVLPDIRRFHQNSIEFVDGRREHFDAVVYATGFNPVLISLNGQTSLGKITRLESTRSPGMFFIGLDGLRTFRSRYIRGIREDADFLAEQIADHLTKAAQNG